MSTPTISSNLFLSIRPEYSEHTIAMGLTTGTILPDDAALIKEFLGERRSTANISHGRANKIATILVSWRRYLPLYRQLTIGDVYTGIEALKNGTTLRGKPFKQNTIADYVVILKQFLNWLIENNYIFIPEKKILRLKNPSKNMMTKTAADILTTAEVTAILQACTRSSDRAFFGLLYEGGFRVGEISQMKWGDIKFDTRGVVVNVNFKTGIPRYIRIVMMAEYLKVWRADYPGTPDGESLVFINELGEPFIYNTIVKRLKRVMKKAGITKHVTPHIFRHSRITHMINDGAKESVIKMMMWGSVNTMMFKTYAHLTGNDIDAEMSRLYGLEEEKKTEAQITPRQCPHCAHINPPLAGWCYACGESLDPTSPATEDQIAQFILHHGKELMEYVERENRKTA
jgi:integrase